MIEKNALELRVAALEKMIAALVATADRHQQGDGQSASLVLALAYSTCRPDAEIDDPIARQCVGRTFAAMDDLAKLIESARNELE